jgi:hypothetical protein
VDIRNNAFQEFEDKMLALSKTKFERTVTAMRLYLDIFKEVNSGSAWLGLWFGDQALRIRTAIDSVSLNIRDFRMLKNAVKKLSAEAINIVRAHDEAVVYNEIMNEQTPGLDPEVFQTRMNIELSRGELQRRLNMKTRYKKRKNWERFEELGGAKKLAKKKEESDDDSQRDNNQLFTEILMKDPFDKGPLDDNALLCLERTGKRPAEWEDYKKRKLAKKKEESDDDSQRDNNQLIAEILMEDPYDKGPLDDNVLLCLDRTGKRPAEWEDWKKKKRKI